MQSFKFFRSDHVRSRAWAPIEVFEDGQWGDLMIQKYANKSVQKIKLSTFYYFQTDVMFEVCAEMGLYPSKYQRANMQVVILKKSVFRYFSWKQKPTCRWSLWKTCIFVFFSWKQILTCRWSLWQNLYFCILLETKYQHAGDHCDKISISVFQLKPNTNIQVNM